MFPSFLFGIQAVLLIFQIVYVFGEIDSKCSTSSLAPISSGPGDLSKFRFLTLIILLTLPSLF